MKKLLTMAVSLILMAVLAVSASASGQIGTEEINFDVDRCVDIAKDFIEEFYTAAYMDEEFELNLTVIDSDLSTIIQAKFDDTHSPRILTPCKAFSLNFKEISASQSEDLIYIELPIAFYFVLEGESESCGSHRPEYFTFRKIGNEYVLENWITSSWGSLDSTLYSGRTKEFINLDQYIDWIETPIDYSLYAEQALDRVADRETYFTSVKSVSETEKSDVEEIEVYSKVIDIPKYSYGIYNTNEDEYVIPTITDTGWSFDRTTMANWARENWDSSNIESGSSVISYTDFSDYGEWDCTNFASHALSAGGAEMYRPNNTVNRGLGWWSLDGYSLCSSSWSGVDSFYAFLIGNAEGSNPGPLGIGADFVMENSFSLGDIIQVDYDDDGDWIHSTVITSSKTITGYTDPIPKVTYHASDNNCDSIWFNEYYYSSNDYRIIRLVGYRTE